MIRKKGFDTSRYLSAQIKRIMDRVNRFDKLYLEFGGKLRYDHHASRVLPGYALDTKVQMLKKLGNDIEIIHCISAKDIERRKIRRDFGLTYEDQILKDISDLKQLELDVSAVIISRYSGEQTSDKFRQRLANRGIRVITNSEIPDYHTDPDKVVSDEGYGKLNYVETTKKIVIITAPGPGSGKMSFAMGQIYHDRKLGITSNLAKFETFPIWNLSMNHPVNIAYEAATADIGDYNCVDPFHKAAYGIDATNYNRDVENFSIIKKIIEKITPVGDPLADIKSPTDLGVNMAKEGIVDDSVVRQASIDEIVRRYYQYHRDFVEGNVTHDTLERMDRIMHLVKAKPDHRVVAIQANKALEESSKKPKIKATEMHTGAAIEVYPTEDSPIILTGKRSRILTSESAALLNSVKYLAGIPDEIDVLSPIIIESIMKLKEQMGVVECSLDVKEVLDALAVSGVFNPNAAECIRVLPDLRGCDMHSTHLVGQGCERALKELGLIFTTDARIPIIDSS
ncbi:MAG: hypothetical protein C4K47_00685 [Candidatus Thorarchaeota archaeon]|nr:MAG: hypothetical protein C4K47_00685 [Candidatus Thorarchaeota archaeon]